MLWKNDDETHSVQYFLFGTLGSTNTLAGTIILLLDGNPTLVRYTVQCDSQWKTRAVSIVQRQGRDQRQVILGVGADQVWRRDAAIMTFVTGLFDVDLEISPATNTLPIRRLNLKDGESRQIDAVWVRFPSLTIERLQQRYTRINSHLYHYEAPTLDFETELELDDDGFITHYHGLWQRVQA